MPLNSILRVLPAAHAVDAVDAAQWIVSCDGRQVGTFDTKAEAMADAVERATQGWSQRRQRAQVVVHGANGDYETQRTFGECTEMFTPLPH